MQRLNLLYQNDYSVYISNSGWCLLSYSNRLPQTSVLEETACLFFFPTGFVPNQDFCVNAESFCARTKAKLVWIENPTDSYTAWKCTVSSDTSCLFVGVGGCNISLYKIQHEKDNSIVFDGVFHTHTHSFSIPTGGITLSLAKSTGELSFAFQCDKNTDLFTTINAGIKYVMPLPHDTEKGYERNYISTFYNSVLFADTQLILQAVITPCLLQDCNSTYIALPNITFKSSLISNTGYPIELNSIGAKLVLEATASAISYDETTDTYSYGELLWYWGIAGDFMLSDKSSATCFMMLGLSGSEYFKSQREIKFVPHQNALIDNNKSSNISSCGYNTISAPWISFKGSYYSSSESMPLFTMSYNQQNSNSQFLRAYTPEVSAFSDFSPPVPILPWKNASMFKSDEAVIVENIIYKNRFDILTATMKQFGNTSLCNEISNSNITAIAPCGLCVSINPTTQNWDWLGIAQTSNDKLPNIRLQSLTSQTRSLFQNKECMITVSSIDEFKALGTKSAEISLPIDGWDIILSEAYWNKNNTLMLIKYSNSLTIREILNDTSQLSYTLSLAYTGEGELRNEYKEFIDIIDNRNFQGVLILGAAALPANVSDEIKAITSDIKSGDIKAVYTVIYKSKVELDGASQISVAKSDISSLFSYKGVSITNENHSDIKLDFRTVGLTAMINQSVLKQFSSRSELLITDLFGSRIVVSNLGGGSCLVLNGILETISGTAVYRFTLANPMKFNSPNTPISEIFFDDLRMISSCEKTDFVLSGKLSFIKINECDIFSHSDIAFTGVKIVKKNLLFYTDYASSALLQEFGTLREHSFSESFGAKISEIIFCNSDKSPDDIAFSSIMTPVKQDTLDKTWNGIVWTVSLGSSGELGVTNELSFEILTAWSNQKYYIGLRLPGVLNKKISLQGLFTAGFSGIDLQKSEEEVLYFRLHGFTLKLLGISIPKNGAELLILGEHGKIAWYMGYNSDKPKEDL